MTTINDQTISTQSDIKYDWYKDFYQAHGAKGLVVLAWWVGSYFSEQIHEISGSYPFMELVGESCTGKTSILRFLAKLSGHSECKELEIYRMHPLVLDQYIDQSNMPIVLNEADRRFRAPTGLGSKRGVTLHGLKDAFNGRLHTSEKNLSATGALMFCQQKDLKADISTLIRTVQIKLNRSTQTPETNTIVEAMNQSSQLFGDFKNQCLLEKDEFLKSYEIFLERYIYQYEDDGVSDRIALCHAQLAALVDALALHILHDHIKPAHKVGAKEYLKESAYLRQHQITAA